MKARKSNMLTNQRKEQLTKLCQELLRNPSVSGEEDKVVEAIKKHLKKWDTMIAL